MKHTPQQKAERYSKILKGFTRNPESVWYNCQVWVESRHKRNRKTPAYYVIINFPRLTSAERQIARVY